MLLLTRWETHLTVCQLHPVLPLLLSLPKTEQHLLMIWLQLLLSLELLQLVSWWSGCGCRSQLRQQALLDHLLLLLSY
jgi:hypothetical protein